VAIRFDYFRKGRQMSLRRTGFLPMGRTGLASIQAAKKLKSSPALYQGTTSVVPQMQQNKSWALAPEGRFSGFRLYNRPFFAACIALLWALPVWCQYPGQVTKASKQAPTLRAVAVLEWTGEAGHPKASRIVPVCVFDGQQLQDGGIYMARPQPLALTPEVEYELQQNGKPMGLFDIGSAGQDQGLWVGLGAWKPLAIPKPRPSMNEVARSRIDEEDSDQPILHRKHHADEGTTGTGNSGAGKGGSDAGSASSEPPPAADPDRPTLHKKSSSDSGGDSGSSAGSASDPDQPTLHRKESPDTAASSGGSVAPDDPDRPVLKKSRKPQPEQSSQADSLSDFTDPDRPLLKRGKSSGSGAEVVPTLVGLPEGMEQTVAVSDAKSRPEHPWSFSWANADDETKMKSALEEMARDALGLNPPPAPPSPSRKTARKSARPAPPPPEPTPLLDEQFRVFELAYGSGATLVLSARTEVSSGNGPSQQKFVTLIAQPDLYGNALVLLKSVTDSAHLDEAPRMRLIDAVDVMADNRGELLFEMRGATQRQFAIYRVMRGRAEKLFVTGGS
jgi:hypothetical protein